MMDKMRDSSEQGGYGLNTYKRVKPSILKEKYNGCFQIEGAD